MEAHKQGRNIVLVGNRNIGCALVKACNLDADSDAVPCLGCNYIVRKDMFKMKNQFNGSFEGICQKKKHSVPAHLMALVSMILNGPNIDRQTCKHLNMLFQYHSYGCPIA